MEPKKKHTWGVKATSEETTLPKIGPRMQNPRKSPTHSLSQSDEDGEDDDNEVSRSQGRECQWERRV